MIRPSGTRLAVALLLAVLASSATARERSEIPEQYRWKLTDLYPSDEAWAKAEKDVRARIPELAKYRGHLGESAASLRKALDTVFSIDRELQQVASYAMASSDVDTRAARPREMRQTAEQLAVDFGAASSWIRPEILKLDAAKVRGFFDKDKGLAPYRFFVEDILRWKPHTLSRQEEHLLAEAGNLSEAGANAFLILENADLPYPTVKTSDGKEIRLDNAGFTLARASPVREDRDQAFSGYFGAVKEFQRTFGTTLYSTVKAHIFFKTARRFGSSLEASLFENNIPTAVYRQLIKDVHRSLPTFHRYLKLRQRMIGVDQLRYQDLYVPMVPKLELQFTPEQAQDVVAEAVAPLGKRYQDDLRKAFEKGWTDYLPSTGKRSGAYSINSGVYGLHPFQLLNFNGRYEDVYTLAHESGHSMHTWLAMNRQPYATYQYPTFVAEVASTLNEHLLSQDLLARAKDDQTRLALLGASLDRLRSTLFRQTQFAEFELAIHEMAERGETLTAENMSALYLKITRDYYGHDQGVCKVDDLIASEWAFIPHFYRGFYVYQYATSMVASMAFAKRIEAEIPRGETKARDAYLAVLGAGGSDYPIDILKRGGVDMTTSAPFDAAIAEMNAVMDQMEKIQARQPAPAAPGAPAAPTAPSTAAPKSP
jgi:oligoendopeptidase F